MTSFSFVATKKDGSTLSSTIESSDRAAAIRSIQAQGLKLVNLKETDAKPGRKRRRKIKSDELVMFTRQLSSMVSAGVPILRSLESMTCRKRIIPLNHWRRLKRHREWFIVCRRPGATPRHLQ